jgi:hypothetical protein
MKTYGGMYSWPQHKLKVIGHLHAPAALTPGKEPRNRSGRRGEKKNCAPFWTRTPISWPSSLQPVATLCSTGSRWKSMRRSWYLLYSVTSDLPVHKAPYCCLTRKHVFCYSDVDWEGMQGAGFGGRGEFGTWMDAEAIISEWKGRSAKSDSSLRMRASQALICLHWTLTANVLIPQRLSGIREKFTCTHTNALFSISFVTTVK